MVTDPKRIFISLLTTLLLLSPAAGQDFMLEEVFQDLQFTNPVVLTNAGDGSDRLFVVERRGVINTFVNDDSVPGSDVFLDIESRVSEGGEFGLLGLAFHPDYDTNGYFYVYYTTVSNDQDVSRVSRFERAAESDISANPTSELVLLEAPQPGETHNAGDMIFGPDGMLYIAIGDGGSDPSESQDLTNLLGTISRIDVDNPDDGLEYGIPEDNPFIGNSDGSREEIFAYGLRNPWRFSIDEETGFIWVADVGDDDFEEINHIASGGNYGWPVMEGPECNGSGSCDTALYETPVFSYATGGPGRSITGGYVYRGSSAPDLVGRYVYGDFVFGRIWRLEEENEDFVSDEINVGEAISIVAFGQDEQQELYVLGYITGNIYRLSQNVDDAVEREHPLLAATRFELNGPNPFRAATRLQLEVPQSTDVDVALYDALGREVASLYEGLAVPGESIELTISADGYDMPAGVYHGRVTTEWGARSVRVVRVR